MIAVGPAVQVGEVTIAGTDARGALELGMFLTSLGIALIVVSALSIVLGWILRRRDS
jgi:hypothetical protein